MATERKQHHPLSGGSRISAYTFAAPELTLITDPKDPLYDRRVEDPLDRSFLLSVADRGVDTAISVRNRAGLNVVIRGKQRTKAVHVVNAIGAGIPYTGTIKAVKRAIEELAADDDFVRKVTRFMNSRPLKIRAVPANSGDDRDVRMSMRAENAHRHGDQTAERIRFVQHEIEKYGTSFEDLALAEGVSEATIKRWAKMDVEAPRRKHAKPTRPSAVQVANLAAQVEAHLTARERALMDWVLGRSNGRDVAEMFLGTRASTAGVVAGTAGA